MINEYLNYLEQDYTDERMDRIYKSRSKMISLLLIFYNYVILLQNLLEDPS